MFLENVKFTITKPDGSRLSGLVTSDYYDELVDLLLKAMPQRDVEAESLWQQLIEAASPSMTSDAMSDYESAWFEGEALFVQFPPSYTASIRYCERKRETIQDALSDLQQREMQLMLVQRSGNSFKQLNVMEAV